MEEIGLYYYVARFYDPLTAHFTSADTIVPDPGNTTAFDRYVYAMFNPLSYVDPSGHDSVACQEGMDIPGCVSLPAPQNPSDDDQEVFPDTTTSNEQTSNEQQENTSEAVLGYSLWDWVPVVSNFLGIVRGSQTADRAAHQSGFMDEQKAYQTWVNNCYGVCHGASPESGSSFGGPMPNVPLVDEYSQGMGEAGGNALSLLIDLTYAKATTNFFSYGGKKRHGGGQTNDKWSIIHLGNETKQGGIHLAIGSVGPRKAFFHIYFWPPETAHIYWPGMPKK